MYKITFTIFLIFTFSFASSQSIIKEATNSQQKPSPPYPYTSEDITFENGLAGITLAGTYTCPKKKGKFPAVILISGNGEHDRDAGFSGHKPFLIIADYLTRNGFAVLRFDKRGNGLSKGNYETATTLDFSTDVEAAITYLASRQEIDNKKIGLIGHSEGGLIAPLVATKKEDVAFMVLLAGPGMPGGDLLLQQQALIAKAKGVAFEIVKTYTNPNELQTKMRNYITDISKNDPDKPKNMTEQEYINAQVNMILSPWMINFLRYNPSVALEKVKCPVLAINGAKDLQVSPKENLAAIENALKKGGNDQIITMEIPDLNHMFQECQTGLPDEYSRIEQSFSPVALNEILKWLEKQV